MTRYAARVKELSVYLDSGGEARFCPLSEATVPITDRGLLFGDGIYEVYRLYGGKPFRMGAHLDRLRRSAREIRLPLPDLDWEATHRELVDLNGFGSADATIYIEVTRGAPEGRGHAFPPPGVRPTVFVMARAFEPPAASLYDEGASAITHPDIRWGRVDVKSLNLLPNVLAAQAATEAGAWEALFVRSGLLTEGARTNVFVVQGGVVRTHPEGSRILGGITRTVAIELARQEGLAVLEEPALESDLAQCTEVFLTGTSAEVMPVVRVDGRPIGCGRPGPITHRLRLAFGEVLSRES